MTLFADDAAVAVTTFSLHAILNPYLCADLIQPPATGNSRRGAAVSYWSERRESKPIVKQIPNSFKPLLHVGGFCRRSAVRRFPNREWTQLSATKRRHNRGRMPPSTTAWAPIAVTGGRPYGSFNIHVQNFRRRAPVKYLSVMERCIRL